MTDGLLELLELLSDAGLQASMDEYGCVIVQSSLFNIWIGQRPHYCDRGRWLLHCDSNFPWKATVDAADGFPRYYFHAECLVKELVTWGKHRGEDAFG